MGLPNLRRDVQILHYFGILLDLSEVILFIPDYRTEHLTLDLFAAGP